MSSCISAIGTANPKYRIAQNDIYRFMVRAFDLNDANAARLKQIYDHSGIDGENIIAFAFGPGLTVESMILKRNRNA